MDIRELKKLKYAELQTMAKKLGIKANMKTDKLIRALVSLSSDDEKNDSFIDQNVSTKDQESNSKTLNDKLEVEEKHNAEMKNQNMKVECDTPNLESQKLNDAVASPEKIKKRRGTYELDSSIIEGTTSPKIQEQENKSIKVNFGEIKFEARAETISSSNETQKENSKSKGMKLVSYASPKTDLGGSNKKKTLNSKSSTVKKNGINKVKTPNFARIHQKYFEQMVSLPEYVEQKKKRQLASSKLRTPQSSKKNQLTATPHSSSKLQATTTPYSSRKQLSTTTPFNKKKYPAKSPFQLTNKPHQPKSAVKMASSKSKLPPVSKLKSPMVKVSNILRETNNTAITNPAPKIERKNPKNLTMQEKHSRLKKPMRATVSDKRAKQREYVKGVRTNKRFELQMKIRMNSETTSTKCQEFHF